MRKTHGCKMETSQAKVSLGDNQCIEVILAFVVTQARSHRVSGISNMHNNRTLQKLKNALRRHWSVGYNRGGLGMQGQKNDKL